MLKLLTRVYIARIVIKISGYKMSKAIKSSSFLSSGAPESKKFDGFSFTSIPIKYDDKDCLVDSKGSFKILSITTKEINLTP